MRIKNREFRLERLNSLLTRDIPASVLRINAYVLIMLLFLDALACSFLFYSFAARKSFSLLRSSRLHRRRLRVVQTALNVLWPVAYVLVRIEDQINRTRHVMLALALAHVVHRAIVLVRVIRYMIVLLVTRHFVRYKKSIE